MPDYVFQEYPKWVRRDGQPDVLVRSKSEEADLLDAAEAPADPDPAAQAAVVVAAEIPADWPTIHWTKKVALARQLPGGENVTKADEAAVVIQTEADRLAALAAEPEADAEPEA